MQHDENNSDRQTRFLRLFLASERELFRYVQIGWGNGFPVADADDGITLMQTRLGGRAVLAKLADDQTAVVAVTGHTDF